MYSATLRRVGGSVMIALPPALLAVAEMDIDSEVAMTVEGGRIIIEPEKKRRYTLAELLDQCDWNAPEADREWVDAPAVGRELL